MKALYAELEPYAFARDYYNEAYRPSSSRVFASAVRRMPVSKRAAAARAFYKDYSPSIDRRIAERMLGQYLENVPQEFRPEAFVRTVDSLEACGNSSTTCSGTAFLLHPSDSSG